jgi:putative CocE/NonD family hydrolase
MTRYGSRLGLWLLVAAAALAPAVPAAEAPDFEFHAPASVADPRVPAALRDLAERVLPVYEDQDTERYLTNLLVLQLAAGEDRAAADTLYSLQDRRQGPPPVAALPLTLYAQARAMASRGGVPAAQALAQALGEALARLSDHDAYALATELQPPVSRYEDALQEAFERVRGRDRIDATTALGLIHAWVAVELHREFAPLAAAPVAADQRRRYLIERLSIPTPTGALHAKLVRPKNAAARAALLEFTIYTSRPDLAVAAAAHGYAGVVVYARGKDPQAPRAGRVRLIPFEHDGQDARAAIRWIARQPWCDGRVGMYGDGYAGFAAWAAARQAPPALKAIATFDALAPGIDFPAEGRIFRNEAYRWASDYTHALDQTLWNDEDWRALEERWYESGRPYRDLDRMARQPNRVFRRWLDHPSYDRYWQKLIPFGEQFAAVRIPVLSLAGYYARGGALYYFAQHRRYRPDADHRLLIGPYDDRGAVPAGLAADAVARIDLNELRLDWFDHVFGNAALPAVLAGRVNYEVMGANQWQHAASLAAMAPQTRRYYLDAVPGGERRWLVASVPAPARPLQQIVDFAERRDARAPPPSVFASRLALRHALSFASDPLPSPMTLAGTVSGRLDFAVNKLDVDLGLALYAQLPGGEYWLLAKPYELRASYAADRIHRRLLKAGQRQTLAFTAERLSACRLPAGSRLVLVLGVNKRPDQQLNYGTGGDVSEESIADAKAPLKIRWYNRSYIEVPLRE